MESTRVHKCRRAPEWWDATTWDDNGERVFTPHHAETLAFVNDASSYSASLLTRPEFGCVMHQPWPPHKGTTT